MRGKVQWISPSAGNVGITPAYAGEKAPRSHSKILFPGSPPPMRGKVIENNNTIFGTGITPAYAGKRSGTNKSICITWDHPRLCGEKSRCTEV